MTRPAVFGVMLRLDKTALIGAVRQDGKTLAVYSITTASWLMR